MSWKRRVGKEERRKEREWKKLKRVRDKHIQEVFDGLEIAEFCDCFIIKLALADDSAVEARSDAE